MAQMDRWLAAVSAELDLNPDLIGTHQKALLDLIATVAHGPSRPGAPLTAFLVGYAAGSTGADPSALADRIHERARNFS